MCMAVYAPEPSASISLEFVFERIFLKRNGTTVITVDCLIRNEGTEPISRLRFTFPYVFVDIENAKSRKLKDAPAIFSGFRTQQMAHFKVLSEDLLNPSSPSNWIYDCVPYAQLSYGGKGTIEIQRMGQVSTAPQTLNGYVKRNWTIESPREDMVDPWMWFILTVNKIVLVDLVSPPYEQTEVLYPKENTWVRLEITLPPTGINAHSRLSRILSQSVEFTERFSSPEVIRREAEKQLSAFKVNGLTKDPQILRALHEGNKKCPGELPHSYNKVPVKDWRIFLYREYGIVVEKVDPQQPLPCRPPNPEGHYELPLDAYPAISRIGWAPTWVYRLFRRKKKRIAVCNEYWIGSDHNCSDPNGYSITLTSRIANDLLFWIGFLTGVLALLLSVLHFLADQFHILDRMKADEKPPALRVAPRSGLPLSRPKEFHQTNSAVVPQSVQNP